MSPTINGLTAKDSLKINGLKKILMMLLFIAASIPPMNYSMLVLLSMVTIAFMFTHSYLKNDCIVM